MILNYIEKAYYINLDYRADRKESFEKRVKNLDISVERFPAIIINKEDIVNPYGDIHWHNKVSNYHSHRAIISRAKELELQNVWVFEDTVYYSDNIVKTDGVYGAHSYLVNNTFYDKILSADLVNGIDILYLNFHTSDKKYYLSREILCNQDGTSYSDIWGQTIPRDEVYKNAYKLYVK